jgi:RNA polymerase sigma-70 factor, ECF subfamily
MADADSSPFDRADRGDREALDELLVRYLPQLHTFVHARLGSALRARDSSVDVVQSVCRQLLAASEKFEFRGEDRFRAWLFTAALNKIRERHRRAHADKRDDQRDGGAFDAADASSLAAIAHMLTPSQDAVGRETATALAAALAELSEEHREVITLARLVELPHAVIAEVMGRTEPATRQLLARGMVQLALALRRRGVDSGEDP